MIPTLYVLVLIALVIVVIATVDAVRYDRWKHDQSTKGDMFDRLAFADATEKERRAVWENQAETKKRNVALTWLVGILLLGLVFLAGAAVVAWIAA